LSLLKEKLRFVQDLRAFGTEKLQLQFDGSFKTYEPKHYTANWLYAVHPDRLASAFPGNETFRFTWDLAQARRWDRYQRGKGRHTYLYSAEAHGGSRCPITPSLLDADRARQCYVVLHEAWHSTLRLEGIRMPYPLEEASGRVVGVIGGELFAAHTGDKALARATAAQSKDWAALARFINRSYRRLEKQYTVGATAATRRETFKQLRAEADRIRSRTQSTWEKEEYRRTMNNAFFFRYHDYTCNYPLSLQVCNRSSGLARAMKLYKRAGRTGAIEQLKDFCRD
jgi:Putative aminopeptidase